MATTASSPHAPPAPPSGAGRDHVRTSAPPAGRALHRRRGLPNGRAVAGGLLVTLAALVTFAVATSAGSRPDTTVVVAARSIAPGERVGAVDVRAVATDLPDEVRATGFASVDELVGAVALVPIAADQVVARSAVSAGSDVPVGGYDLSFGLERERALDGRLQAGERIDLVATTGTGADASTDVVARDVRVVTVDTSSAAGASGRVTVTVALEREDDVLAVAHALEVAQVTLVRSTGAHPTSDADGTGDAAAGDEDEDEDGAAAVAADRDGAVSGAAPRSTGTGPAGPDDGDGSP